MLGNNQKKNFLSISNGKINYRPGGGAAVQEFDYVEGQIKEIRRRIATINGADTPMYEFVIIDGSETYCLSAGVSSIVAQNIINALATVENFGGKVIKISPWLKTKDGKTHTNVSVYANGNKLEWFKAISEFAPLQNVKVGSKLVIDDSDRIAQFEQLVEMINRRLAATSTARASAPESPNPHEYEAEPDPEPDPEDMPQY